MTRSKYSGTLGILRLRHCYAVHLVVNLFVLTSSLQLVVQVLHPMGGDISTFASCLLAAAKSVGAASRAMAAMDLCAHSRSASGLRRSVFIWTMRTCV